MQAIEQQLLIREKQIVAPLVEVLNAVNPTSGGVTIEPSTPSLKKSLDELFPEQQYDERSLQKAKEILGSKADSFTNDELKDVVTEVQYLVNSWLDEFERDIFEGVTLKELLHEKGSL